MNPIKLVILDRDGTINEDRDDYVKSPDEWEPLPGALEAIARLNHAGWHMVVATNQSGLGRGLFDMATLNAMHLKMNRLLAKLGGRIDAVFFCPHAPERGCDCRKPLPGLFEQIGERYGVDLKQVPVVGDSLRDLQAGAAAGCAPHLVLTGKAARIGSTPDRRARAQVPGTTVHADLARLRRAPDPAQREERGAIGRARFRLRRGLDDALASSVRSALYVRLAGRHGDPVGDGVLVLSIVRARRRRCTGGDRLAAPGDLGRARDLRRARTAARHGATCPTTPVVLLPKHQSTWETFAFPALMPHPLCYVFKRELLYVPFFGWAMGRLDMIHIDRSKRTEAWNRVAEQGRRFMAQGNWVIMFPEGTRIAARPPGHLQERRHAAGHRHRRAGACRSR